MPRSLDTNFFGLSPPGNLEELMTGKRRSFVNTQVSRLRAARLRALPARTAALTPRRPTAACRRTNLGTGVLHPVVITGNEVGVARISCVADGAIETVLTVRSAVPPCLRPRPGSAKARMLAI